MTLKKNYSLLNFKGLSSLLAAMILVLSGSQGLTKEKVANPSTTNIDYYPLMTFFEYMDKQGGLLTFKRISSTQFRIVLDAEKAEIKEPECRWRAPRAVFEITDLGGLHQGAKVEFLTSESQFKGESFDQIILPSTPEKPSLFKFVVLGNPGSGGIDTLNITLGMKTLEKEGEDYDGKATFIQFTKTGEIISFIITDQDQDYESNTLVTSVKEFSSAGETYKNTLSCN